MLNDILSAQNVERNTKSPWEALDHQIKANPILEMKETRMITLGSGLLPTEEDEEQDPDCKKSHDGEQDVALEKKKTFLTGTKDDGTISEEDKEEKSESENSLASKSDEEEPIPDPF